MMTDVKVGVIIIDAWLRLYEPCSCKCFFDFIAVCIKVLDKFAETLSDADRKDKEKVENKLKKFCKDAKGKDERFVSMKVLINHTHH